MLAEHADEDAEAAAVAGAIADLVHGGLDPAEIAVLYRVNAQSERIEAALDEVGIGYRLRGGEGFFERPAVRRGWGWHRLWGLVPVFPLRRALCEGHCPEGEQPV